MQFHTRYLGPSSQVDDDQPGERKWSPQAVIIRRSNRKFAPPTDIIELFDRLVILVEIAGMRGDDFKITLLNRTLVISGYRERPPFDNPAYHQVEINFGEFRVEVSLPWSILQDEVSATYGDGFLQIDLPRRDESITVVNTTNKQD